MSSAHIFYYLQHIRLPIYWAIVKVNVCFRNHMISWYFAIIIYLIIYDSFPINSMNQIVYYIFAANALAFHMFIGSEEMPPFRIWQIQIQIKTNHKDSLNSHCTVYNIHWKSRSIVNFDHRLRTHNDCLSREIPVSSRLVHTSVSFALFLFWRIPFRRESRSVRFSFTLIVRQEIQRITTDIDVFTCPFSHNGVACLLYSLSSFILHKLLL